MENIGESNSSDQFYRYKRPKLVARIEGRGNGIKTNTVNLVDISKALERPPDYVLKFFGCELGAQTKYDKNSGTCIVNGAHEVGKLNELLEAFTKKYVQCHECGNPETRIRIKKENIFLKCKACGAVSDVDMRHRLNTYIIKNPPEEKVSKAEKRLKKMEAERMQEASGENLDKEAKAKRKKDKEAKKKKKAEKGDKEDSPEPSATENGEDEDEEDEEEEDEEEVEWMTDTSAAAQAARAAEQLTGATADMVTQGNIEAEREEARKVEKARKKEEARLAAEAQAKAEAEAAAAKAEAERAEAAAAAQRKAEADKLAADADRLTLDDFNSDPAVLAVRELATAPSGYNPKRLTTKLKQLDFEGGVAGRARLVYLALFGNLGSHKLGPAVEARAEVLLAEAGGDHTKQVGQLVALEYLVGVALPDKVKQTAVALKALYDEDVVEEDVILAWHEKATAAKVLGVPPEAAAAVRAAATPFVDWLREASDEEEESDEE